MLNLVYTHHLKGEAVSEQALRNVLGRKELPKWYTYINYLQDSNLITMTEEEDYVLKKDLSKMTLWDFYRTLPYPLPIKDELDEMSIEDQKPWLSLLVDRFENTEAYAKQQLALPLNMIFAHSEPRKKSEESAANSTKNTRSKLFRKSSEATPNYLSKKDKDRDNVTPDFDPIAYDKDSDVECDENNNEILIPKDIGDNKPSTLHHRIGKRDDIITEADKPIIK
jgi:membrane protein